jgi:DNA-binding NtrC family response regulator
VPPGLAESELFGHEAGAFTGAQRRKRGLLELAEGGTLLLNEIGELSSEIQAKLLDFIETRTFRRVGGEKKVKVNARLMAATNRPLEAEVAAGRFRQDLFYRINVLRVELPPLRERLADIPALVRLFMSQLTVEMQTSALPTVDRESLEKMSRYHWPGNVRELRNIIERGLILCKNGRLTPPCIDFGTQSHEAPSCCALGNGESFAHIVRATKKSLIEEALRLCQGKREKAAQMLGMSRHALKRQMKTLGLYEEKPVD